MQIDKTAKLKSKTVPKLVIVSHDAGAKWAEMVGVAAEDELAVQAMHIPRDLIYAGGRVHHAPTLGDTTGMIVLCDGDLAATLAIVSALRARCIHEPLLVVTPEQAEDRLLCAYAAGVDECIPSTIGLPLLLAKLRAWLRWTKPVANSSLSPVSPC